MKLRDGRSGISTYAQCVRYGCAEWITFEARQPPLYCSGTCRVQAARDREWLICELIRLTDRAESGALHAVEAKEVSDRRALVEWHLRRYAPALISPDTLGEIV